MTRFPLAMIVVALLAVCTGPPAAAHAPRPGPNGGLKVDAGTRHHAELVADGTTRVVVFLYDQDDKPVPAAGYRANAVLVVDGAPRRFNLQAENGNRLVGVAPVPVPARTKGAVQITGPDGVTAQARF